jgi:hypothetical protein
MPLPAWNARQKERIFNVLEGIQNRNQVESLENEADPGGPEIS